MGLNMAAPVHRIYAFVNVIQLDKYHQILIMDQLYKRI